MYWGLGKLIFAFAIAIFLVSNVAAWSNTTFNNSLPSEVLTFVSEDPFVRYLSVPSSVQFITSAFMNITGFTFEQKEIDGFDSLPINDTFWTNSTSGSGVSVVTISNGNLNLTKEATDGAFINFSSVADEDIFTLFNTTRIFFNGIDVFFSGSGGIDPKDNNVTFFISNSTLEIPIFAWTGTSLPESFLGSNISIFRVENNVSYTINESLMNSIEMSGNVTIRINVHGNQNGAGIAFLMDNVNASAIEPVNLSVGSTLILPGEISPSGEAEITIRTSNLNSILNSYLAGCSPVAGFCDIPFSFQSIFPGTVNYSDMFFSNLDIIENSQTFSSQTIEGSVETFTINISFDTDFYTVNVASLEYAGTSHPGSVLSSSGSEVVFTSSLTIPSVLAETNNSFSWLFLLNNGTGITTFNSSSNNQTVSPINIDNCTANSNVIANFSLVDEEDQTVLVGDIEVAVNLYDLNRDNLIHNFSESITASQFALCSSVPVANSSQFSLDLVVKYSEADHAVEYYNFDNFTLNNETVGQNVTLFDLNLNESVEFQVTFTGADFLPVSGALVIIERQYIPENVFKTVELPKTDANGQTVVHLVRNDVVYNIRIVKNGVILGNFESITAFCEDFTIGDCTIILNAQDSTQAVFDYNSELGIIFQAPSFNSVTKLVTFSYVTTDGSTRTVVMNVTRDDIFGVRSLCFDVLVSAGGTLSCNIGDLSNSTIRVTVLVDGVEAVTSIIQLDSSNLGEPGYLIFFMLAMTMILMFSTSKSGVLVAILISVAGAIGLNLISGDLFGFGASGLWIILVIILGLWKLNKGRQQ